VQSPDAWQEPGVQIPLWQKKLEPYPLMHSPSAAHGVQLLVTLLQIWPPQLELW
jgi:hypothetical protein